MRFLVDAQLPPALARLLSDRGHLAEHVTDIGPGDSPDRDLWRYAIAHGAVIVTKDEDFSLTVAISDDSPTVVWVRAGNGRKSALLTWFETVIDQITALVDSGQKLIELRSR